MPRREVLWATRLREELLLRIAGSYLQGGCQREGCEQQFSESPTGDLSYFHIHHPEGRDWEMRKLGSHNRVARLWREWRAGIKLEVWCKACNGWDGNRRRKRKGIGRWEEANRRKRARKKG
jgi:hypothetical protein